MNWIKERIDSEYKKHKDLDWSKIASKKIESQIRDAIKSLADEEDSVEIDIGEYDKFISVHYLCKRLGLDFFKKAVNDNGGEE